MEIKVYLVEKLQIIREGFKALLAQDTTIKIVAEAVSIPSCDPLILQATDVLMVEYTSHHQEFFNQIKNIKFNYPKLKILIFTDEEDNLDMLRDLLELGISGYLTKNASKEELFHSIHKLHEDGIYICTAFVLRMLKDPQYFSTTKTATSVKLSATEITVLKLIADGLTNNDIALQLSTSVRTIEARRKNILDKTKTSNTATLIKFAVKHGIIS